jgi:hypothetical protein
MRGYSLVSLTIGVLYTAATVALIAGPAIGVRCWLETDKMEKARAQGASVVLRAGDPTIAELRTRAVMYATGGITFGLIFGFLGQLLSMLRNQAINSDRQLRLLGELVALREQELSAVAARRVAPCEGCGKLAGVERIESGQWVCVDCRRALRTTA